MFFYMFRITLAQNLLNVITSGLTNSDVINRLITIKEYFYILTFSKVDV
jgi:hypothetical protein